MYAGILRILLAGSFCRRLPTRFVLHFSLPQRIDYAVCNILQPETFHVMQEKALQQNKRTTQQGIGNKKFAHQRDLISVQPVFQQNVTQRKRQRQQTGKKQHQHQHLE